MSEGCDRDTEDQPGGSSKPKVMRPRMHEGQLSTYSFSARATDPTLQIGDGSVHRWHWAAWSNGRDKAEPTHGGIDMRVRTTWKLLLMECQASAARCVFDQLRCLFEGVTESGVRLPVRHQITETLWCSTKKTDTVVETCEDQRPHQGVWWVDGERPTDRPKLADVEVARPRQPGDVLCEADGGIDVRTEIANRLRWLYNFSADGDWIEGASGQTTRQTQPDEFRLRWIQLQSVARHPTAHDLDAVSELIGEMGNVAGEAVIINLQIICVSMDEKPLLSNRSEHICSIENEIQWAEYGTLRHAALHHCHWWCWPIVSHILPPSDKVRLHPVEYHTGKSERCLKSVEEDAVIHTIEGGTQIEHTEQG